MSKISDKNLFFIENTREKNIVKITNKLYNILLLCVANDETIYFMESAYFIEKDKKIYATDTRCIIAIDVPGNINIKEGYYITVKVKRDYLLIPNDCGGKPPDFKKVIPDYSDIKNIFNLERYSGNLIRDSKFICELIRKLKFNICIEYLKPLKWVNKFNVKFIDKGKPISFYGDDFNYCFMGIGNK